MEIELTSLRAELDLAQKAQATARWQQTQAKTGDLARTATTSAYPVNGKAKVSSGLSSRSSTPPATNNGVWSSIHAPKNGKVPVGYQPVSRSQASVVRTQASTTHRRAPSPAQSVVSQAPTLRDDGWWE